MMAYALFQAEDFAAAAALWVLLLWTLGVPVAICPWTTRP